MPENELKQQSKVILNALGQSFALAFALEDGEDDSITALLERLDEVGVSRDVVLDSANARVTRLLSNTANQTAQ